MKPTIRWPVLVACAYGALGAGLTAGQEVNVPGETTRAEAPVETKSLRELRRDMRRAQERFTDLYNTLNQDRDQQIVCDNSAATGTRLTRPNCMTRAEQEARARDAVDYLAAADLAASLESGLNGVPQSPARWGRPCRPATPTWKLLAAT